MLSVKVKVKHHYSHFAMDKDEPGNYLLQKLPPSLEACGATDTLRKKKNLNSIEIKSRHYSGLTSTLGNLQIVI